jgi:hypothetical protein
MILRLPGRLALAASLLLLGAAAARGEEAAAGALSPSALTWYAQALTRGPGGINVTHFWSMGRKLRAETVVAGRKVVTIVNGERYYSFDAVSSRGVSIQRAPKAIQADASGRRPFGDELETLVERQGAEKVRDEVLHGRACDVYRVTDVAGRRELWITRDEPRIPLRVEIFQRGSGSLQVTDYLNWLTELPIPESFFVPGSEIEIESFSLEEYYRRSALEGPVGPVPILYSELLHGGKEAGWAIPSR